MAADHEVITWKGRCGPFDLVVSDNTFRPTTVSSLLADSLEVSDGDTVIDAGCGSGVLSIVAAKLGATQVYGVDNAPDTVEVATANAQAQGVSDVTTFLEGDLYEPLPPDLEADLIIGDISGVPDSIAAISGWFPGGRGGGPRGAELPIRMLEGAGRFLRRGGRLFIPTGTLQDEGSILTKARSVFGEMKKCVEKNIPLPSALAEDPAVVQLLKDKVISLTQRGSRFVWTARVWEATLA